MSWPGASSECRGPALCVGARRSLCRGPALLASGISAVGGAPLRGLSLCVGSQCFLSRSVSGPKISSSSFVCVGARRSVSGPGALCRGSALFVSGLASRPGALCRGPAVHSQDFIFQIQAVCVGSGAYCLTVEALCVGAQRSLCRGAFVCRGPGALCVGARRFLSGPVAPSECRGPALFGALCQGPARLVSGPGDLRRFVSGPVRFVSVAARRSLCRGRALSVWAQRVF